MLDDLTLPLSHVLFYHLLWLVENWVEEQIPSTLALCEHTRILGALVENPQGNLEEIQRKLCGAPKEPGGRPYRKARTHPTRCTRTHSTKRYTVVELCYVTQVYAT